MSRHCTVKSLQAKVANESLNFNEKKNKFSSYSEPIIKTTIKTVKKKLKSKVNKGYSGLFEFF